MAAPNVNGRLQLTVVHQKPPASLLITQYGVRINPSLWFSAAFGELDNDRLEYKIFITYIFIIVALALKDIDFADNMTKQQ